MVIVGLLLLIASLIFGADLVVQNADIDLFPNAFGVGLGNITAGGQFALGVITGLAIALGIGLILAGTAMRGRRAARRRGDARDARRDLEAHQVENARLSEELERERAARGEPVEPGPYPERVAYRDVPAYQDVPAESGGATGRHSTRSVE